MLDAKFWIRPLALCALLVPAWGRAEEGPSASALAQNIDRMLVERASEAGVEPAALADDAEFCRRVWLDLNGIIPTAGEAIAFLEDQRPDKRARLIDRLLESPRYATHMANTWAHMLLPADTQVDRADQATGFTRWLRRRFAENSRYDLLVADLLTTTGGAEQGGAALFYTAAGLKPEELAASTSRIFLGVQIHCAQCHDHPFDKWKQEDFWSYAAFFSRLEQVPGLQPPAVELIDAPRGELMLPGTQQVVLPKYLGDEPPAEDADVNRRRQLALWMVSRDNPFFARVAANRAWAHLFGRGLVEPVDDFGRHNPPSHPEVLDQLTRHFVDSGYDLKALWRVLANTQAYQRTSQTLSEVDEPPPELFVRMQIKPLKPEQLYDCLTRAMLQGDPSPSLPSPGPFAGLDADRQQFIVRFGTLRQQSTEFEAGIPQVLALMNGPLVARAAHPKQSSLLQALEAPFYDDTERVELLFLSTLSRLPSDDERAGMASYATRGGATGDGRQALGDILWALLNSPEFIFNH